MRLASELLEKRFGKKLGFADDGVVFLDPAVGTGTYLVASIKDALEKVKARSGQGAVPARAGQMVENMYGFEILVGPYAVAHLRLTQALEGAMNEGKSKEEAPITLGERLRIYLADTLASPNKAPPGGLDLTHKALRSTRLLERSSGAAIFSFASVIRLMTGRTLRKTTPSHSARAAGCVLAIR